MSRSYTISGYLVRFLTPALPALCRAIAAAIVGRPSEQVGDTRVRPPGVLGLSVAGATLAGAAALAVFVAVAAVTPVLPEVSALAPRAEVQGGSVVLSWDAPQAPARLGYQLTRWRRPGEEPTLVLGGTATSATDKPGPGSWWYRVAITPGSDPSGWPPRVPLGVSRPVLVKVPAEG